MVEKNTSNQSVDKMFSIIETMAFRGSPMRLNDIAEKSGVSTSTAMRILNALIANGYAFQDEETSLYSLSYKFMWIGNSIQENLSINQLLRPYLKEITRRTGISCALALNSGNSLVYVDEVVAQQHMVRVHHYLGKPFPLYNTACGKVFLSGFSDEEFSKYIRQESFHPTTPRTICTPDELRQNVNQVKALGYAFNDEEAIPGMRCLAFPLLNSEGFVFAGVSLSGTTYQITKENKDALVDSVNRVLSKMYEECRHALAKVTSLS